MEQEKFAIELENLTKCYKLYNKPFDRVKEAFNIWGKVYNTEKHVLNQLNLKIEKGAVIGIVGNNGAGKSTLLKIITGVLTPTSGKVLVNGKIAALLELGTGFNPEFTGIKNIYLNGTMMGFTHAEMDSKLQEIIDFADIGDFIYQPVKTYSSGMFARLAFAVAINVEPEILIVDEALSVGDMHFQMKCMDKMKDMMDKGVTTLFVSHDINAIRRFCTMTAWLKEGVIEAFGETNRVCDQYMDYLKVRDVKNEETSDYQINGIQEFIPRTEEAVAEIAGIRLLDENGKENEKFDIFRPMTIELYYDVYDEKTEYPVLGVAIKRIDDEYICGVNTLLDNIQIPWRYGRNRFKLVYNQGIRVLGGQYYLDVAIFDKTATVPIQYFAKIKTFTVTADYIGEGVFIVPHEWRK